MRMLQIIHLYKLLSTKSKIVLHSRLKQAINQNYCQKKQWDCYEIPKKSLLKIKKS